MTTSTRSPGDGAADTETTEPDGANDTTAPGRDADGADAELHAATSINAIKAPAMAMVSREGAGWHPPDLATRDPRMRSSPHPARE